MFFYFDVLFEASKGSPVGRMRICHQPAETKYTCKQTKQKIWRIAFQVTISSRSDFCRFPVRNLAIQQQKQATKGNKYENGKK